MTMPEYIEQIEARAYALGYSHGRDGGPIAHNAQLKLAYPNAYHKGYWDGVADQREDRQ